MITQEAIREIIAQYERFGWQLERVVITPELRLSLTRSSDDIFKGKPIAESDLDAAWFSRLNDNGRVAWELRSLGVTPFALVDSAVPDASESDLNELFQRVEDEMRGRLIRPRGN